MSRRKARRAALNILFQADVSGQPPEEVLADHEELDGETDPFTAELVRGVAAEVETLDRSIASHSEGWTVERLGTLERSILRLACYELGTGGDVSAATAIDEAVEAARELGTPEAARFVNGVLGAIARG